MDWEECIYVCIRGDLFTVAWVLFPIFRFVSLCSFICFLISLLLIVGSGPKVSRETVKNLSTRWLYPIKNR